MALLSLMLVAVPARGQAPLVVGSVRDQNGAAIAGAVITGEMLGGGAQRRRPTLGGTFALHAKGIVSVLVTCRYCRSAVVAVTPDEPIVLIVRRYAALADDSPSRSDLANLPYDHVESSIALAPFTLLSQSSAPYPGALLSDRGLSSSGSLLIDDGAPNYDTVDGQSPYVLIPGRYAQNVVLRDATNAYAYGDQAAGGVVELDPFTSDSSSQIAIVGSDTVARAQVGSDSSSVAVGSLSNDEESRQRGDATASWPLGAQQSLTVAGGAEQGREYSLPASAFAGSFSFADAQLRDPRALNLSVTAVTDRGDYTASDGELPIVGGLVRFRLRTRASTPAAPSLPFADAGVRSSTGFYDRASIVI